MKMQHNNEIKLEKQGEVTIFDIRGDLTSFSETSLNDAYQKANDQVPDVVETWVMGAMAGQGAT